MNTLHLQHSVCDGSHEGGHMDSNDQMMLSVAMKLLLHSTIIKRKIPITQETYHFYKFTMINYSFNNLKDS